MKRTTLASILLILVTVTLASGCEKEDVCAHSNTCDLCTIELCQDDDGCEYYKTTDDQIFETGCDLGANGIAALSAAKDYCGCD